MTTVGLALPHYDHLFPRTAVTGSDRTRQAVAYARAAEQAGLSQVWVSDHLWLDPGNGSRLGSPDCWTLLAAIAVSTERIRLGSLVSSAPLRSPAILAHQVATGVDRAGDRVDVGIGAGWNETEFLASEIPFPAATTRLAGVAESAAALRLRLGANCPPIWVGGKRGGALRTAAHVADGWNLAWNPTPDEYVRRRDRLDAAATAAGRAPHDVRASVGLVGLLAHDEEDLERRWAELTSWVPAGHLDTVSLPDWRRRGLVGVLADVVDRLLVWESLGVDHVVCGLGMPFGLSADDQIELLACASRRLRPGSGPQRSP